MQRRLLLEYKDAVLQKSNVAISTRGYNPFEDIDDITDIRASENMFGSLGGGMIPVPTTKDFIPADSDGSVINIDGSNVKAKWIGLGTPMMQYWAYKNCSPLGAVIDKLAEADTNGILKITTDDGVHVKNPRKVPVLSRVIDLFAKPNHFQTWEEFNSEQVIIAKKHGYCIVLPLGGNPLDKTLSKYMFNISPLYVRPVINDDFDYFDPSKGSPIKGFEGTLFNKRFFLPFEDIIIIKDGFVNKHESSGGYLPLSKIEGLDFFVSNICAAMEADNVLLKKKGPLGVFSHDPKPDMAGWLPLDNKDKLELQRDLKRYGMTIGQLQYIISKTPLKWNPMSFNVRDLMTKETIRQAIDGICDRFGYPAELMSGKNATYENRDSAEKYLYQNNIIPFSIRRMAVYTKFFDLGRYKLNLDYSHLPVLQEDSLKAGQASEAEAKALLIEWQAGMLTWNQWQQKRGRDTVSGMDIFYPEWYSKFGKKLNQSNAKDTTPKN